MKILYIDCAMGAAGDMLTAALSECLPDQKAFLKQLNQIGLPNVQIIGQKVNQCGIVGTQIDVRIDGRAEHEMHHHDDHHEHHHHHHSLRDIEGIVAGLKISEKVRKDIMAVYALIAEAESAAHGVPVSMVHFHEVGMMDAVADITAVCLLMDAIRPDRVVVSPICVGSGHVHCAHGVLPVPAPATAYLLKDCPVYGGEIQSELCTPTGAALLRYFADDFGSLPMMTVKKIGFGLGHKVFDRPNGLRVMLGERDNTAGSVVELCCNLDDMTGEALGFATAQLLDGGALDVFTTPVVMKKNRPGVLLTVLCESSRKEKMLALIFRYTTTIGVREHLIRRYTMERQTAQIKTAYGTVTEKTATGYGVTHRKIEYDDLARIAKAEDCSLETAREMIHTANRQNKMQ